LNFTPEKKVRTVRFASETLPGEKEEIEVKNTQYPVLKRRFNPSWIKKDITSRRPVVSVQPQLGGNPFQFEFVSYGQTTQSGAGIQRESIWIDESCPLGFYEEQLPRLFASNGDMIMSYTPIPGSIGWEFDVFYERAKYIYRTQHVLDRIYQRTGEKLPMLEVTNSKEDIAVIMAATDDNPIYEDLAKSLSEREGKVISAKDYLDDFFSQYADADVVDARRYGLFRQLSGRVHKNFGNIHIIDGMKYFPQGLPFDWIHARGIDYHQKNPWTFVWLMVSPKDEIFVVRDADFNPTRMMTYDIAHEIATMSGKYKFKADLIDPLASQTQVNTNLTTVEDLNRFFHQFRSDGYCSGGYWQSWDTKGTRGREELTARLINSSKVGRPFNNEVLVYGRKEQLPTIWFLDRCRKTIDSMRQWRYEEWGSRNSEQTHDEKETPQTKFSHFPITVECLLKSPIVSMARFPGDRPNIHKPKEYFKRFAGRAR
jgi:hypothetical protein